MDVGALRKVLKRYGHWRLLQDHVRMLTDHQLAWQHVDRFVALAVNM
jgi:hypothetical protein